MTSYARPPGLPPGARRAIRGSDRLAVRARRRQRAPGQPGWDQAKKANGRKRHIAVETAGLLLPVVVTAASV